MTSLFCLYVGATELVYKRKLGRWLGYEVTTQVL